MGVKNKLQLKTSRRSGYTYLPRHSGTDITAGVHESSPDAVSGRKIETLLSDIVTRLDRIEEKIDENVYPPESAIRPEFIRKIKKAQADIRKGKGKTYESMDAFIRAISE